MAQRLVRAKAKIRQAAIPYRVPPGPELPERIDAVMAVIYLVFNEGYAAAQGGALVRAALCEEALRLGRLLRALTPIPWVELDGLVALMLLHDARRAARVDAAGDLVLLEDQDRAAWDRAQIDEGLGVLQTALGRGGRPGPYALQAAIAAVHAEARRAEDTDWRQILALYDRLYALHPSPVIALNRAVAVAMADGAAAGLTLVDGLEEALDGYHLYHAARADLLKRLGRRQEAARAYQAALRGAENAAERRFLERRLAAVGGETST
jgi:RNA polymerase sigma-70 factor (ECF subfamily)